MKTLIRAAGICAALVVTQGRSANDAAWSPRKCRAGRRTLRTAKRRDCRRHPCRARGAECRVRPMRPLNAGVEPRPVSSICKSWAAEASGFARSETEAVQGRTQNRRGRWILPRLCARLRRRLLSCPLCRRPRLAHRDLPGVVSERRDATLFHAVRRHDRGLRFGVRPAVREPPQRRQIRAGCRSELLLPAQGSDLGGGARGR